MDRKSKHLEFVLGIVNRLASDSFRVKGWCVVLVAALITLWRGRAESNSRPSSWCRDRFLGPRHAWITQHLANAVEEAIRIRNQSR